MLSDTERLAGAPDDSLYSEHPDPLVRYVLRPNSSLRILDGTVTTNALGLRVRPGPPPTEGALRIVILGDSVAFGYGVDDDETLAARLEVHLTRALEAQPGEIVCDTVAVPSWNHRAAVAALFDHWDTYRPDIVVYFPIHNDLSDANGVLSTGQMRQEPDPSAADPWLIVSRSRIAAIEEAFLAALAARGGTREPEADHFGPCAIEADLSPESSRRYAENVESIRTLDRRLRERDARLLVVQSAPQTYAWHLLSRLASTAPEIPVVLLERYSPVEHTLLVDNHPSATTLDVRALWIADELSARAWVAPGVARALPPVPADYAALRLQTLGGEELRRRSDATRQSDRAALQYAVDLRSGRGLRQVYGGLNPDASAGMSLLVLLRGAGPRLQLRLAPLLARADLYPIDIDVEVNGQHLSRLSLTAQGILGETVELPANLVGTGSLEVRLRPSAWCVVNNQGRAQVSAFQPISIACPPHGP